MKKLLLNLGIVISLIFLNINPALADEKQDLQAKISELDRQLASMDKEFQRASILLEEALNNLVVNKNKMDRLKDQAQAINTQMEAARKKLAELSKQEPKKSEEKKKP